MTPPPLHATDLATHRVTNQVPPLGPVNLWDADPVLRAAVTPHAPWAVEALRTYGGIAGGDEMMAWGEEANRHPPEPRIFDRYGHRTEAVDFHPAYHQLLRTALAHRVHNFSWTHEARPGAHVARLALSWLHNQPDQGTSCPLTMTHASVPVVRQAAAPVRELWLPRLLGTDYDPAVRPAGDKNTVTFGMGMTEKQGGSDVRANATVAVLAGPDGAARLTGHKWFFSAPMSDAWLVLAREENADGPLSCFLVPKVDSGGGLNAVRLQRLKDKLGNHSNASSEVEFADAEGWRVGAAGRGVPVILDMVMLTRLDCMAGSASLARMAFLHALHHARHRKAFGKRLIEQPLMRRVLADLDAEIAGLTRLTFRIAAAVDRARFGDAAEAALARVATAAGKYWICKRTVALVNEAQECLGGAGYVEETPLPRYYREAPLNSIWEGSGNVQALDVLRALDREPESRDALETVLAATIERPGVRAHRERLHRLLADPDGREANAREIATHVATGLIAGLAPFSGEADDVSPLAA